MTIFTQDLADKICYALMEGKSLTSICKAEDMPDRRTVHVWLKTNDKFREEYEFARNVQYECMLDEIMDIADDGAYDLDPISGKANWENVNRSRLRVEARKWALSHVLPKKYGAKVTQEVTGANGGPVLVTDTDKFDLARWIAFQLTAATEKK